MSDDMITPIERCAIALESIAVSLEKIANPAMQATATFDNGYWQPR